MAGVFPNRMLQTAARPALRGLTATRDAPRANPFAAVAAEMVQRSAKAAQAKQVGRDVDRVAAATPGTDRAVSDEPAVSVEDGEGA